MSRLGSIGDIGFESSSSGIRTYGAYSDKVHARVGDHEVGGAEPVLEWIGPGVRTIEMSISLNRSLGVDVESDIARAQEYSSRGSLLVLTLGGQPVGGAGARWIIESVETLREHFDRDGAAILAELILVLRLARTAATPKRLSQVIEKQNVQRVRA